MTAPIVRWRALAGGLGLLTLAAAWLGPLPALARGFFSAHMTMHMAVVAVAAPLLALAVAGWHAPALHHAARHSLSALLLEQLSFLTSGLYLWCATLGRVDGAGNESPRRAAGVVALLLTSMHMTLLGALIALATRPLYPHGVGRPMDQLLEDQQLGGAIMLLVGGLSYLTGGLALSTSLLRARAQRETPASGAGAAAGPRLVPARGERS
jgi:putative membrane protein